MDGFHSRCLSIHVLKGFAHHVPQGGFPAVFPCRIGGRFGVGAAQVLGKGTDLRAQGFLGSADGAAHGKADEEVILFGVHNAQVQRGFHQSLDVEAHGLDAVWDLHEHKDGAFRAGFVKNHEIALFEGFQAQGKLWVLRGIILLIDAFQGFQAVGSSPLVVRVNDDGGGCFFGDDVVLGAAGQVDDVKAHILGQVVQQGAQKHAGIGAVAVDLLSRVATVQAGYGQLAGEAASGSALDIKGTVGADTAGAAGQDNALVLGIEVDHISCVTDRSQINGVCALHAHFFLGGEDHVELGVGQCVIVQQCQTVGHCNAVIAA